MWSDKRNILQLVALCKACHITQVVNCVGGWCVPLAHAFCETEGMACHALPDARTAAFFALGLSLQHGRPVVLVADAALHATQLLPAMEEARQQGIPLVVATVGKPYGVEGGAALEAMKPFVRYEAILPEVVTDDEERLCNFHINMALLECVHHDYAPVHLHLVVSEPIYRYTAKTLPEAKVLERVMPSTTAERHELAARISHFNKRMVVVGQMNLIYEYGRPYVRVLSRQYAWLAEAAANRTMPGVAVRNFDVALYAAPDATLQQLRPDLLITFGGQVVSKSLRKFLHAYPPKEHWHISADGLAPDTYGCLTTIVEMNPFDFLEQVAAQIESTISPYPQQWESVSRAIPVPDVAFCELSVVGCVVRSLPPNTALHLCNGSVVRYAQLFPLREEVEVCCNLGCGSPEGSLATAIGYASGSQKTNFVLVGDLSFLGGMNVLAAAGACGRNLRVIVINNRGAECLQTLPGMERNETTLRHLTATHAVMARGWADECGMDYLMATNMEELVSAMGEMVEDSPQPMLLEVFTDRELGPRLLREYYHGVKAR